MNGKSNGIETIEVLMKAASFFLAGFFILTIVVPSDISTLEIRGWITLVVGVLVCIFGFLLSITAIPINSKNKRWDDWRGNMNSWSKGGSSILFAVVVVQLVWYIFEYKEIETLRIFSIVFLILFGVLFIVTLVIKSSVFHNIKSNLLFIITMTIFSIIMVLTEELERWGLFTIFMIILLSSVRLWYLEKARDKSNKESESKSK